jgi:hypothetical protein
MTAKRQCGQCGEEFVAKRSDALYCTPKCRQKHFQDLLRSAPPGPAGQAPTSDRGDSVGQQRHGVDRGLAATVEAQLRTLGRLHTVDGQAALGLAEHLSRDTISGSERSSMTKSLNEVMARVLRAADDNPDDDPVHILQQRAKAKRLIAEGLIEEGNAAYEAAMTKWNALHGVHRDNPKNWLS